MRLSTPKSINSTARNHVCKVPAQGFGKHDAFAKSSIPPNKQRFIPTSGTYPKDFVVGSVNVGINPSVVDRGDLVLVTSKVHSNGAAVFTKNAVPASSIIVSRELMHKTKGRGMRGIIANAGCANVWTGEAGLEDTTTMGREADKYISGEEAGSARESSVMVMHTGAGGVRLPIDKIVDVMPRLHASMGSEHEHWYEAARALLTTDTFPKLLSRTFTLPSYSGTTFSIAGITKGAGMIHPNMATTLAIVCTDAPVSAPALQQLLSVAADKSYNCISIEGDTSTNDMVAMLANGAAVSGSPSTSVEEVDYISSDTSQSPDFIALQNTLISFMASLAKLVVRDGEGATKFITIRVRNSPSYLAAKHIASRIARSVLLKTAIYGSQTECWGNVLAALGYAMIDLPDSAKQAMKSDETILVPELTSIGLVKNPVDSDYDRSDGDEDILTFFSRGIPLKVPEKLAKEVMEKEDIEIVVNLRDDGKNIGNEFEEAIYWTCDITHEFVTVNGDFPK